MSEETQRKDIIATFYAVAEYQDHKKGVGTTNFAQTATSIPTLWDGTHMCCDNFKVCMSQFSYKGICYSASGHQAAPSICHSKVSSASWGPYGGAI